MTDRRTMELTERVMLLERDNLALRLKCAQLEDVVKQQDAALLDLSGAAVEFLGAAMPSTPCPARSSRSQGQPDGSPGEMARSIGAALGARLVSEDQVCEALRLDTFNPSAHFGYADLD